MKKDPQSIRYDYSLEGASNYISWKARITLVLMENGLWNFANSTVTPSKNPRDLTIHRLKDVKVKRIILDVVKDHLIPHIAEKKLPRGMWEDLTGLYQSNNHNRKMVLKEDLKSTKIDPDIGVET